MKMITLLDKDNRPIAINSDQILTIDEDLLHKGGIIINMTNNTSIPIPHTTIEEVVAKINTECNIDKIGQMTAAICDRISHLEDSMAAGLQYIGRSCN